MPWTKRNYPPSLKNFEPRVRGKAVEIANALLEEGYEEGRAIAIATSQAKEWNENHPEQDAASGAAINLRVVPHEGSWAIKRQGSRQPEAVAPTKEAAENKAKQIASDENICVIVHRRDGTVEKSFNYR
ncbi:DUF2188 domain-containing protein [Paenibacillus sp. GYB004]|uniref:DUF2188 domain-containing protein n=1 Tax=Paenibacillus sp. GYB004 TaxID=2994393 RepID=UPI002F969C12